MRPRFRTSGNGRSATRFTAGSSPIDPPDGSTEPSIDRPANARSRIEAVRKGIVETWRSLVRVFQLVWATSRVFTVVLAAVTLIQSVIPASQVWLAGRLIDEVARGVAAGGGDEFVRSIVILAVLQLVLFLAASLFQTLGNITQQLLQEKLAIEVQLTIMRHANLLDLAAFENAAYYDQLQQAQRESANRPVQMVSSVFGLIRSAITFASMIALLVSLSPWIAVGVLIAPMPAFISGSRYGWWGFQQMRRQSPARRRMSYLTNVLTTDTYNKEIKLFTIGDHFITRYRDIATGYYQETRQLLVRRYLAGFGWGAITIGASSATYLYVAILALRGSITLGSLAVFVQAAQQVQFSFQGLLGGVQGIYEHGLYLSTLYELLDREPQIQSPENPVPLEIPFQQGIEFRNVSFRYPDTDRIALDNVSFTIGLDETVALVGKNGAGKSTIVKLLGRLYDPGKGQIFINGHDVRDYDPHELRQSIGVVFQDYVAYQLTVRENIGVGNIARVEELGAVETAAEQGGADRLIAGLPDGYDTVLGKWFDQGNQLSGGEWQRIALSRAFMRDAEILVLDEPTSALDAEAEHDLFARIQELARGKMALFISHRFSTTRQADRIFVLDQGRLIEQGTHEELMAIDGSYARLFRLQAASYFETPSAA